ncbi:MAG: HisA/HisF-related TIM barrel protein [Methylophilaceae bacterium]|nr:HisA/HisF-related TIM barrel protein [Methylophilaceae bacterium]
MSFWVIPVVDLMGNKVVRARQGERHAYRPLETPLCASADPLDVACALFGLYPFTALYVADLDAIQGRGSHYPVLRALRRALPDVELWVDAGIATPDASQPLLELGLTCVVGSESQRTAASAFRLLRHIGQDQAVLSLDYAGNTPMGPEELFIRSNHWPQRVIAMTLKQVGSHAGPDWERLDAVLRCAEGRAVYAAGGVRDVGDLIRLKRMGASGALVASALHDGTLSQSDLNALAP